MSDQWDWEEEPAPRYTHYQVQTEEGSGEEEAGSQYTLKQDEKMWSEDAGSTRSQKKDHRNQDNYFRSRAGAVIALGVVFGLTAGLVFSGVSFISSRLLGTDSRERSELLSTDLILSAEEDDGRETSEESSVSDGGTVARVAGAAMPAVVAITSVSIQEIPDFFGYRVREYPSTGSGSGIIVGENDEELLIATNNHVVEGADTLSVCFIGNDVVNAEEETLNLASGEGDINVEDAVTAKIKGTDPENDLAVIAVNKSEIPDSTMSRIKIIQLGSSENLMVGEQVVAIGNALGYGQSVTSGWISALDRSVYTEDGLSTDLIQTDAAINPGNSGGALLNMRGELIGINSAKYASQAVEGMGYAIPISKAGPILEELMSRKTREKVNASQASYLGIQVADLTKEATQMYNIPLGAFVIETVQGGPADQSGIRRGDIIVCLDGQKITSRNDLYEKLAYYAAGETIDFQISRASEGGYVEQDLAVTLGARPD